MQKIFNDPVYGFVTVPQGTILKIIDHPYFQRLRRIKQLGMASVVYPGAQHTRFQHALGALHLMQTAIDVLLSKGVHITDEEREAVCMAILLHDIGHGPFSHALEHTILDLHHEELSLMLMQMLNKEMGGKLNTAIAIFSDIYPKKFLHQLVSGQLDMDRLDYLNRDSFFTGVSEGVIGYDRIIKMLAVKDDLLVVEEKGIYSIEKFLISRRLMYWQVYLHKTGLAAESMLIALFKRAKALAKSGVTLPVTEAMRFFLYDATQATEDDIKEITLQKFIELDDNDISIAIKEWSKHHDFVLSYLAKSLHERKLFGVVWHSTEPTERELWQYQERGKNIFGSAFEKEYFLLNGSASNQTYNQGKDQIHILFKNGIVKSLETCSEVPLFTQQITKFFICCPKEMRIS